MQENGNEPKRPIWSELHPAVYKALIACAVAMALCAWLFASRHGYTFAFVAIGFLAVVAATVLSVLSRFVRRRGVSDRHSLDEWRHGDMEVYDHDRMKAPAAMTMILIAPLAGAIGLVVLAVIDRLVVGGVL